MALPEVTSVDDWLRPGHVDAVVEHLRDFARDTEGVDLDRLAADPYGTLEEHPTLTIEHSEEPIGGCAVYGHYRPEPPTIHIVRAATFGRDHFTLLHEYTHHLQQHDPEWAEVEWRIKPEPLRLRITEAIANDFASTALIPHALLTGVSPVPAARQMAELHQSVRASRQAAIVRVTRAAARTHTPEHFFVSLINSDGNVVFSQMVGDNLYAPPRGSHQPDMQRLFDAAVAANGHARGVTSEGITYSTGSARLDVRLDLHLAHDGGYAFVVGTPEHRYGKARWDRRTHMCPSPACEAEFVIDESITLCRACGAPRCPECRTCDCEPSATAICANCFTELSAADRSAGRSSHDECPW